MKIVIDTNILFSALLSKDNKFLNFIFSNNHVFYTCNYLFLEIYKYKEKISKMSGLSEEELLTQMKNIFSQINFINESLIPKEIYQTAYSLCNDIDKSDTPFVALAIFLDAVLVTGDKKLKNGLKLSEQIKIKSINDFLK